MKIKTNYYLYLSVIIMIVLFISSSMTYKEQTSVPFLAKYMPSQPFKSSFETISFFYGKTQISIENLGYYKFIEFFIRKLAHFSTYFIMGFGFYMGLKDRIKNIWLTLMVAYLSSVGYAGLDEFHQMITGDRTPSFEDVMLDGIGALTAVIMIIIVQKIMRIKRKHKI